MAGSKMTQRAVGIIWLFVQHVSSFASSDTITWDGDNSRIGYQDNHNMDPSIVGSPQFGQLFRTKLPGNYNGLGAEQVFSQPLVYTLSSSGKQYVYVLTTQNNLYQLDSKTGSIVQSRNLHIQFLASDLDGCVDINPTIGVTGTGVVDPSTETLYFVTKTYKSGFTSGRLNGESWFHAVDVNTLQSKAGFPKSLEGAIFRNNPRRMFISGNQNQRPGLLQVGQYIYAAFASHCVQYNFTGAILGWDKDTGALVEAFATEGGPEDVSVRGGGVWMSGGGLSYDEAGSMYFATGNGYASQLHGVPVGGRQPPSSLEEAAVNARVNDDGTITPIGFFMPWEKTQLDGADKDLGTTPLVLLPTSTFSCPNAKRIGVVTGKSGKTYWLNLDNLGGYQMGPNQFDNVPQQYLNENSVYSGAGVMPLDGGYVYINVIRYPTHVWKFGCDGSGNVAFTHVADTNETNAYILGVGHGTTTSLGGQSGTGLLWTYDVEGLNLRIYKAVPNAQGSLDMIKSFNVPGSMKFGRPVFGDGTCYVASNQGYIYGFGSPVNLALNCTPPASFGTVDINKTSPAQTITCKANTNTQVISIGLVGNANFVLSNPPTVPLNLAAGASFTLQATFIPKQVGPLSSNAQINTTSASTGYTSNTPVTLRGTGNSKAPLLAVSPNTVSFAGIITGQKPTGVNQSAVLRILGNSTLNIKKIQFSMISETGPWMTPNVTGSAVRVGAFTLYNLPQTINAGLSSYVTINYNPSTSGNSAVFMSVQSDGGSGFLDVLGRSGTYPKVLIEFQSADGTGWVNYSSGVPFTFGNVTEATTSPRKMRLTNIGGPSAAALSVTVSKPPSGVSGIVGAANNIDLAEGTVLSGRPERNGGPVLLAPKVPAQCRFLRRLGSLDPELRGPGSRKQVINFTGNAVSEQVGPVAANGSAVYRYKGCAIGNNPGRQLKEEVYADQTNNTIQKFIAACGAKNYAIAGTQYQVECWCGNVMASNFTKEVDCNFPCSGDPSQTCGGNGQPVRGQFLSIFSAGGAAQSLPPSGPAAPPTIGSYSYQGCYSEGSGVRALSGKSVPSSSSLTLESCTAACQGFQYFGAEYGAECYCGNTLGTGSVLVSNQGNRNMPCGGNSSEICGAGNSAKFEFFDLDVNGVNIQFSHDYNNHLNHSPDANGPFHRPESRKLRTSAA
ncbi:Uu.00g125710.m01.CDS01 [Anthostomella pinea]|uniref:Uu.00g125710.m01.CDS01 n=1 Tax=Anthostomella pinea TaxID=933095 RepID=A0AAI8YHV2_9PEZI|nr:Uu.00g125710.m01.CDS01 [Anthostomella pinea]